MHICRVTGGTLIKSNVLILTRQISNDKRIGRKPQLPQTCLSCQHADCTTSWKFDLRT